MISKADIQRFINWKPEVGERVLSVYLGSESGWGKNFQQKFEAALKTTAQAVEKKLGSGDVAEFRRDVARARGFLRNYQPGGLSVVIFADASEDFIWTKEFKTPLISRVVWQERPYVLPILEAMDEWECCGVILADKKRARLFTYVLGEIEEEKDVFNSKPSRHFKSTSRDNLRSAYKLQRTAEMHIEWELKNVAKQMEEIAAHRQFDRLILGGAQDAVAELQRYLAPSLRQKVVGKLRLPVDTPEKKLAQELAELEKKVEREREEELVTRLIKANRPDSRRVLGVDGVLPFLDKGALHQLIYSENFEVAGCRCSGCGYLYSHDRLMCGRCESKIQPVTNLLEEMAYRVVGAGGSLEEVRDAAAKKLDKVGGIGAILKGK